MNTEYYSWDTSFVLLTLVLCTHVGKLYSASTLVLFLKCFMQLGWGLTGVRSTPTECSLNVLWMFLECSLKSGCSQYLRF